MMQGVAVFTLSRICQVNLFQPILLDHGIGESSHGGVLAAMTVAEAVASARPQWLSRRLTPVAWVSVLSLALAGTLAGLTLGGPWAVVALLCLFAAATGFAYPVQRKLVNDAVPAHAPRATLLSVESIVDRAVCALAAVAAGAYLSAGRLDALLWHSALATAVLLGVFQLVLRSGVVKRPSDRTAPGVRLDAVADGAGRPAGGGAGRRTRLPRKARVAGGRQPGRWASSSISGAGRKAGRAGCPIRYAT